jgi:hypothetical protein
MVEDSITEGIDHRRRAVALPPSIKGKVYTSWMYDGEISPIFDKSKPYEMKKQILDRKPTN